MTNNYNDSRQSFIQQKQGPTLSFEMLINRYQSMITGFLLSRTSSAQLVEDISQEVWLKAWQNWDQFDETKGTEAAYLLGIARHEAINHWRCTQGKELLSLETTNTDSAQLQLLSAEICLLDLLDSEESLRWYAKLLATLLAEGGYPHQVLAFLFSRVIHCSEDTTDRFSGYPGKTAEQQGNLPLAQLHQQASSHYGQYSTMPVKQVNMCFQEMQPALSATLEELFQRAGDSVSTKWATTTGIHQHRCRNTCLQDYASEHRLEKAIADWCYKVARRLKKKLVQSNNLTHGEGE